MNPNMQNMNPNMNPNMNQNMNPNMNQQKTVPTQMKAPVPGKQIKVPQALTEDEKEEFGNEIYEFVSEIYPE